MKNKAMVNLIESYQKNKSVIGVGHCKFYPTCSCYAKETYKKFNFFYASLLTIYRLLRCNPFNTRKYDPVKLTKKEKQEKKYLENISKYLNNDFVEYILGVDNHITTNDELYSYIYDYVTLESHSHNDYVPYNSRYILTKDKLVESNKIFDLDKYLKISDELYNEGILKHKVENKVLNESNLYITPLDMITIKDYLNMNPNKKYILINNIDEFNYLDYPIVKLNKIKTKELEKIIEKYDKAIILTNTNNILPIISLIDLSINIYNDVENINYFFDINLKSKC